MILGYARRSTRSQDPASQFDQQGDEAEDQLDQKEDQLDQKENELENKAKQPAINQEFA
jgi:hypothetical protein